MSGACAGDSDTSGQPVTWLSGEIVTILNKFGIVVWLAALTGTLASVLVHTGRISIAPGFRLVVIFALLGTVFMSWLSLHLQRVGYAGGDLVVSSYLRCERIPLENVEAVEAVWWYSRRMVRIRLRSHSCFGDVLYYIPKWAAFRCLWAAPERDLQELLVQFRTSHQSRR